MKGGRSNMFWLVARQPNIILHEYQKEHWHPLTVYGPFSTKEVKVTVKMSIYVLWNLNCQESINAK